jgi:hypothetical protein
MSVNGGNKPTWGHRLAKPGNLEPAMRQPMALPVALEREVGSKRL